MSNGNLLKHLITCVTLFVLVLAILITTYNMHYHHVLTENGYTHKTLPGVSLPYMVKEAKDNPAPIK